MEIKYDLRININDKLEVYDITAFNDDEIKMEKREFIVYPFLINKDEIRILSKILNVENYISFTCPGFISGGELQDLIDTILEFKKNGQLGVESTVEFNIIKEKENKTMNMKSTMEILTNQLTFEAMLPFLKQGFPVARTGWNGKGMYVLFQKGYPEGVPCNKQTAEVQSISEGDIIKINPYFQIKCVNGTYSMWVPSINDILAEDWQVLQFVK